MSTNPPCPARASPASLIVLTLGLLICSHAAGQAIQSPQSQPAFPSLSPLPGPGVPSGGALPPVGSTTFPGTTTQIFPHPPSTITGSGTGIGMAGNVGSAAQQPEASPNNAPTSVTATPLPGYAVPGTIPLPGYTAPPGTIGFPPVTSVPVPGAPLVGDDNNMTGSSGVGGASGAAGR